MLPAELFGRKTGRAGRVKWRLSWLLFLIRGKNRIVSGCLCWHRKGFRLFWKLKSRGERQQERISRETIELIRQMVRKNRLRSTERIRGELLKLGIHVAKRAIQRYMRLERLTRPVDQTWSTFLKSHAKDVWACDFVPVIDLVFRQIYIYFIVELETRRVVHLAVTTTTSTGQSLTM